MPMLGLHAAKIHLPDYFAVRVEGIEAVGTEERIDSLAVGGRGVGGEAAGVVTGLKGKGLMDCPLPHDGAVASINRHHHELNVVRHGCVVMRAGGIAETGRQRIAIRDRRREINAILPHDGRRMPKAGQFDLPAYVARFAPFNGRISHGSLSRGERPPPLTPVPQGECIDRLRPEDFTVNSLLLSDSCWIIASRRGSRH